MTQFNVIKICDERAAKKCNTKAFNVTKKIGIISMENFEFIYIGAINNQSILIAKL